MQYGDLEHLQNRVKIQEQEVEIFEEEQQSEIDDEAAKKRQLFMEWSVFHNPCTQIRGES